ncbi:MAG: hypothetical protein LBO04_07555 [Spirochaetaceae bacterium]|jgi:hypothetical protein|nr:hypothetical protein [Spirochaetaceae bacterium]
MKKQGLFLGFAAALLGAAFILAGCEQEAETKYVNVPEGFRPPENTVFAANAAELKALLADEAGLYPNIGFKPVTTSNELPGVTVPAGKTLYIEIASAYDLTADVTVTGRVVVFGNGGALTLSNGSFAGDGEQGELVFEDGGHLSVANDTLFATARTGLPKTVSIRKGAALTHTGAALTDKADITKWVGYAEAGSLDISTNAIVTTSVTPNVAITAIGPLADGKTVKLKLNTAPTAEETSLEVPAGVNLTIDNSKALDTVESLTVYGTLNATGATLKSTEGASINLGPKGEATLGNAKIKASVTVPAGAWLVASSITAVGATETNKITITYKAGHSAPLISDIDLPFSGFSTTDGWTLADDISLATNQKIAILKTASVSSIKITVPAGKTIDNDGTITLGEDVSLVLTAGATDTGAKISGAGKIIAAKTEISGVWQAVGASGHVTIAATDDDASSITASAAAAVLTAGTGGTITQLAGTGNNLTIGTDTTIDLKNTSGASPTVVGSIKLAENATADAGGKLTFSAGTSIVRVGSETDDTTALGAAGGVFVLTAATGKIAVSDFANVLIYDGNTTADKLNTIKGGSGSGYLQAYGGNSPGNDPVVISASTVTGSS